ncbi:MAG: flagellar basal-body rod protein FlgG [Lachnospiraceae bacterium]
MMRSLWSAASGMIAQQTNLDTISNNVSNVNTTGYKKETVEFKSLLYQTLQSTSTNNAGENKPVPAQVGLGTRTGSITKVFTQGNLQATDNATYMAIEGNGFFKVRDIDGNICYTRDGSFNLQPTADGGAMLCTSDGYPVLDQNNNTIVIPTGYKTGEITVDREGNLFMTDMNDQKVAMTAQAGGQAYNQKIGLVQFNNPSGLNSAGGNLYTETVASGAPLEESTSQGLKQSLVHQGYIEMSNVQVADEMVNMIVAQRAYEMNSKAIQASDEMLQQANNLRG